MINSKLKKYNQKNMLSVPLFRHEAQVGNARFLGQVKLTQSNSSAAVILIASAVSIAFVCFVLIGEISRKTRVVGITSPVGQTITLAAPVGGILRSYVGEGQYVEANENLFRIEADRWSEKGALSTMIRQQIIARDENARAESILLLKQFNQNKKELQEKIRTADAELTQVQEDFRLIKARADGSKNVAEKYKSLSLNGYVSPIQAQQKSDEYLDYLSKMALARRTIEQITSVRRRLDLEKNALETTYDQNLTQIQNRKLQIAQELIEHDGRFNANILAPKSGYISAMSVNPGQFVQVGQSVAMLLGDDCGFKEERRKCGDELNKVEVHLYIPSRNVGFVEVGQSVQLRIDAFPYQKFGVLKGVVEEISLAPFPPSDIPRAIASTILDANQRVAQIASNEGLFRIRVSIASQYIKTYGQNIKIKSGLTLEADIVQDKRKIWEWVLEPIIAFNKINQANKN